MTTSADPAVQRLALRHRLRQRRIESGQSRDQVAEALGWSLPELVRVEGVEAGIDGGHLQALLDHYGIGADAPELTEFLGRLAAADRRNAVLSREVRLLVEYERTASVIRTFESAVVPGLLQTREYAEAVLTLFAEPADVEPLVAARLARQDLLERSDPPELFFLLDESVLRRWTGGPAGGRAIMRRQIEHLKLVAQRPCVHIRIVPYGAGLHEGVKGPFVILEFVDADRSELLYLEDARGDYFGCADVADLGRYLARFSDIAGEAAPENELDLVLDGVLRDLDARP